MKTPGTPPGRAGNTDAPTRDPGPTRRHHRPGRSTPRGTGRRRHLRICRVRGPSFHAAKPNLQKDVAIFVAVVRAVRVPEFFDGAANPPNTRSRLPIPQETQLRRLYRARRECGIDSLPPLPAAASWRALQACLRQFPVASPLWKGANHRPSWAAPAPPLAGVGPMRSGVANAGSVRVGRAADWG